MKTTASTTILATALLCLFLQSHPASGVSIVRRETEGNVDRAVVGSGEPSKGRKVRATAYIDPIVHLSAGEELCFLLRPQRDRDCGEVANATFADRYADPACRAAMESYDAACAEIRRDAGTADLKPKVYSGF